MITNEIRNSTILDWFEDGSCMHVSSKKTSDFPAYRSARHADRGLQSFRTKNYNN